MQPNPYHWMDKIGQKLVILFDRHVYINNTRTLCADKTAIIEHQLLNHIKLSDRVFFENLSYRRLQQKTLPEVILNRVDSIWDDLKIRILRQMNLKKRWKRSFKTYVLDQQTKPLFSRNESVKDNSLAIEATSTLEIFVTYFKWNTF